MPDDSNVPGTSDAEKMLKLGWKELQIQSESRDHLDLKTGTILGFALVSVVELLGFLLLVAAEKDLLKTHPWFFVILFSLGLVGVLVAMILSIVQLRPMSFNWPDLDFVWYDLRTLPPEKSDALIVRRMRACIRVNDRVHRTKGSLAIWAAVASGFALLCFAVSVVIILIRVIK